VIDPPGSTMAEDYVVTLGFLGIVGWVFFGFIVGLLARALLPGRDAMGFIATTILGILGAIAGGGMGQVLGLYAPGSRVGFLGAIAGAFFLLFGYRSFARNRAARSVARAVKGGTPRRESEIRDGRRGDRGRRSA
jgi:uncharacterized membrane protein YeaQ/YmgE (transglycosylase-associated protein family)